MFLGMSGISSLISWRTSPGQYPVWQGYPWRPIPRERESCSLFWQRLTTTFQKSLFNTHPQSGKTHPHSLSIGFLQVFLVANILTNMLQTWVDLWPNKANHLFYNIRLVLGLARLVSSSFCILDCKIGRCWVDLHSLAITFPIYLNTW